MNKQLLSLLLCLLPLFSWVATAQDRVQLVYFRDKANSPFSVNRPSEFLGQRALARRSRQNIRLVERDLPVNPAYLDSIRKTGAQVLYPTRWLNGAIIRATDAQVAAVNRLSVVRNALTQRLASALPPRLGNVVDRAVPNLPAIVPENYGGTLTQIRQLGADAMHRAGFRGEGIQIAVLDETFPGANRDDVYGGTRILGTYNMNQGGNNVFSTIADHGSRVFGMLAANRPGEAIGFAYRADFYLFITEDFRTETRAEEGWWLAAAERADSLGVDVISTSVGYSNDFDDPSQNYTLSNLDGRTAIITQAADFAAAVGMVVVKSAGNKGATSWQKITFPGDADSILTVGSVDGQGRYVGTSSRGPTADGRIKPDVAAQGSGVLSISGGGSVVGTSGTSFAAPSVAGLVAGFWQANPTLTNLQVIDFIRRSATRFRNPNDSIGYGIPHFERAQFLVTALDDAEVVREQVKLYPNPAVETMYLALAPSLTGQATDVQITDVSGRMCFQLKFLADGRIIDLRDQARSLTPGVYLVRVRSGELDRVFKVTKE